jgi:hypothetical protein
MPSKEVVPKYTLVQHSAFVDRGDTRFKRAVETRMIRNPDFIVAILKVGGRVYDNYLNARQEELTTNYPPHVRGMIPSVDGKFEPKIKIDNAPVYIPEKKS